MAVLEEKKNATGKKKTKYAVRILIGVAFFVFLILTVRMAIRYYSSVVTKDMAYAGTMTDQINIQGLVLYDYDLYECESDYEFIKCVIEGERVPVNYLIGTKADKDIPSYIQLQEINDEILAVQQIYEINSGIEATDLKLIEEEIENGILHLTSALKDGKLAKADEYASDISSYYQYKEDLKNGLSRKSETFTYLQNEQAEIRKTLAGSLHDIYAEDSGYLTYEMQGNQEIYDYDLLKDCSVETLNAYIDSDMDYTGAGKIKIATSKKYYIATVIPSTDVARISNSETLCVYIASYDSEIEVKVDKVIVGNSANDETAIFLEVDSCLSELVSIGRFEGTMKIREYTGLKVPIDAIKNFRYLGLQQTQMAVVKGIEIKFIKVDVIYYDDTYAIVEDIDELYDFKVYDYFILDPDKVEEGDIVN